MFAISHHPAVNHFDPQEMHLGKFYPFSSEDLDEFYWIIAMSHPDLKVSESDRQPNLRNYDDLPFPWNYRTAKASENGWLEDDSFPFSRAKGLFSGDILVVGRVIIQLCNLTQWATTKLTRTWLCSMLGSKWLYLWGMVQGRSQTPRYVIWVNLFCTDLVQEKQVQWCVEVFSIRRSTCARV